MATDIQNLADIELIFANDKIIHTNRYYLAKHSVVFCNMFTKNFAEKYKTKIHLPDDDYDIFNIMLQILENPYTSLPININNLYELLILADKYQINNVLKFNKFDINIINIELMDICRIYVALYNIPHLLTDELTRIICIKLDLKNIVYVFNYIIEHIDPAPLPIINKICETIVRHDAEISNLWHLDYRIFKFLLYKLKICRLWLTPYNEKYIYDLLSKIKITKNNLVMMVDIIDKVTDNTIQYQLLKLLFNQIKTMNLFDSNLYYISDVLIQDLDFSLINHKDIKYNDPCSDELDEIINGIDDA